ncbi:MAG: alpha/beta fold hydrolase, partial [Muribaculaceae bacterium]|nr:alpha/beta fold hydrolase [Muribaculaceae bacterium]
MASDFIERELHIENPAAGITLGGTITVPTDNNPRAALLLASGSGAQNRDEELLGHRPFKVLAEYLASRGYAVLRVDDRGVGESGGDPSSATLSDYVSDLSVCLSVLAKEVPLVPMGVIGHSEGGLAAIRLAGLRDDCLFIVTLGAPAWPGDSVIMSQARAMATAMSGRWDGEAQQRRIMELVKSSVPAPALRLTLNAELASAGGDARAIPAVKAQVDAQLAVLCSLPYREMLRYDPAADIAAVSVPWLAVNGEKDLQVIPDNLATISALNPSAVTLLLPSHNHL